MCAEINAQAMRKDIVTESSSTSAAEGLRWF
jgi:hypothetical protein